MNDRGRAYIVEDDTEVRNSLQYLLEAANIEAETYSNAEEFLADDRTKHGCLIADVNLGGMSGLELQEQLAQQGTGLPVIIMTGHGTVREAMRAIKKGAVDFIEKPLDSEQIVEAVRKALKMDFRPAHDAQALLSRLTAREHFILSNVARGLTSRKIGVELGLSPRTVEVYRARLMMKIGVKSLSEVLFLFFLANGAPPHAMR